MGPLHMTAPLVEQVLPPLPPLGVLGTGAGAAEVPAAGAEAAGAEAAGAEVAAAGAEGEAVSVMRVVRVEVLSAGAADAADEAPGAKTPPVLLGAAAAEVAGAPGVPEAPPPPPTAFPQPGPVGGLASAAELSVRTFWPGFGNLVLKLGGVVHCAVAMLATNMSGSWSKAEVSLAPPVTVTGAQFMYSSGPPLRRENHVHARVTWPLGTLSGILNLKGKGSVTPGQPPSMDMMTLNLEFAVGVLSVVTESWQLPPPWIAEPLKDRVCSSPTFMLFMVETVNPRLILQGYCSAVIGALSSLSTLNGTGLCMIIWAFADAKRKAAAAVNAVRRDMVKIVKVLKLI